MSESMTAAAWASANRILDHGVRGDESDTGRYKVGDGISPWKALNYSGEGAPGSGSGGLGPCYYMEFVDDTHEVNPDFSWQVQWNNSYFNEDVFSEYPGILPAQDLLAIPPGIYQSDINLNFDGVVPEDLLVVIASSFSDGNSNQFAVTNGPFYVPVSSGPNVYLGSSGVIIVPEGALSGRTNLLFKKADAANPNTDPVVVGYTSWQLNKIGDI